MEAVLLSATARQTFGKKNKALRRSEIIPLHVYGLGSASESLQASLAEVRNVLRNAGYTTPVRVKVEGGAETVSLLREVTRHAVTGDILHVDLLRVDPEKPIEARVPVRMENAAIAPGTRGGAGVVTQGMYEVLVSAKPFDVPRELIVDCTKLTDFDSAIKVADLPFPPGVAPAGNASAQVAWIQAPRVTKVAEVAAPVEGEVPADGAAAVAGAPAATGAPAAGGRPATGAAAPAAGRPAAGAGKPAAKPKAEGGTNRRS